MATIINKASDCTVKVFKECLSDKYKSLIIDGEATDEELKQAFENIYAEYIDLAGLFQTREFELYGYIDSLDKRVNTVKRFIQLQKEFINQFGLPFMSGFEKVKKYGHTLYFVPGQTDLDWFVRKLDSIALREKKYEAQLASKVKDLIELQKKKINKEHNPLQSRKQFITMINRLQQQRFVIDNVNTTMEDLALMVNDSRDEAEAQKAAATKTKRY